ncbi:MAG: hypothetical protein IJT46_06345 [Bacteroidaceae bacterium]|nr:hypothetical protein [Bacteroidaceae bacterium]
MIVKHGRLLTYGLMALLFTACSKDDEAASYERLKALESVPVAFGAYVGDAAGTRAGWPGTIGSADVLATNASGFGVFGYYTQDKDYPGTKGSVNTGTAPIPNFMYNQQVNKDALGNWSYTPVKYWPNETDNDGANGATMLHRHRVSFFAYAPYAGALTQNDDDDIAGATSSANEGTASGIIAVSGNAYAGNPTITYRLDPKNQNVDLLWGTAGATDADILDTPQSGQHVQYGTPAADGEAPVNINLVKQKLNGKIAFDFKHTLSKIGDIKIIADINGVGATNTGDGTDITQTTRITVKSITITTTDESMPNTGTLDLATGVWTVTPATTSHAAFSRSWNTVASTPANDTYQLSAAIRENDAILNNTGTAWDETMPAGVTCNTLQTVYQDDAANISPILFFPGTAPKLTFTIDYYVRTVDTELLNGYSEIEQIVTKRVEMPALQRGKEYGFVLRLGLTTVRIEANVTPWSGDTPVDQSVNLPINVANP